MEQAVDRQVNVNKKEIDLLKATFRKNEALLKSIRALFLGMKVSKTEKDAIRSAFASKELLAVFERRFLPTLDRESPIGQVQDEWLGAEKMIFGMGPEQIAQAHGYKVKSIAMTRTALDLLKNPDGPTVSVSSYKPKSIEEDPLQIDLLSRNQFLRHVENQLTFIWVLASAEEQTPEQKKEKSTKDSSR